MTKKLEKVEKAIEKWLDYITVLCSFIKPRGEGARAEFEREFTVATSRVINAVRDVEKSAKKNIWKDFE